VRITERLALENEMRQALDSQQFELNYQPIVSLETNCLSGFEALLRWRHPRHGILQPADFLSIAAESRLITPIDYWVLHEACSPTVAWQREYPHYPPLTISVNLSPRQISRPDLIEQITHALQESGLDPSCLKIEITENAILENNLFTLNVFSELKAMGVEVQIDDFGTGYSSLSYLSHFPVNALKIDQTFIHEMVADSNHLKIVQAIIMLTKRLDVVVIAEGVETEEQLSQLKELGCTYGQGYYLSRPLDRTSVGELLEEVIAQDGRIDSLLAVQEV
jgi:EAL domain-containing protein (putative c-di-GMP-specific phosphodiesterase class I)